VELSEGKGGERAIAILRFLGGSHRLFRLRTTLFWLQWQALICTGHMSGFMGPGKPSSPVTTLSNRSRPASRWFSGRRIRHQDDGRARYRYEPRLHPKSVDPIST
jgi:hypothetical protein